jgi:hypothetical protein
VSMSRSGGFRDLPSVVRRACPLPAKPAAVAAFIAAETARGIKCPGRS